MRRALGYGAENCGCGFEDGTPRVWYSFVAPETDGLQLEHRSLSYDHANPAAKMRRAGLAEAYADGLASGLWPSLDVLPAPEAANTGKALAGHVFHWRPATIDA